MTDGDAIMASVLANPQDDAPRLVYADWLEENGQEDRAAFIRSQIAGQHGAPSSRFIQASGRLHVLARCRPWEMRLSRVTWPSAVSVRNKGQSYVVFRRGFVDGVWTHLQEFRLRASELFAAHPIQVVRLFYASPMACVQPVGNTLWLFGHNGPYYGLGQRAAALAGDLMPKGPWPTPEAATEALSTGLVRWGRRLVAQPLSLPAHV